MLAKTLHAPFLLATGRAGLIANVAVLLFVTIAVNGLLFALGWAGPAASAARRMPLVPPDMVIGLIWTVLIGLMGAARWVYVQRSGDHGWRSWASYALAAICIAFPFYTDGLKLNAAAFWGTVVTIVATIAAILVLRVGDARAPWYLLPTACWGGYVVSVMLAYPPA